MNLQIQRTNLWLPEACGWDWAKWVNVVQKLQTKKHKTKQNKKQAFGSMQQLLITTTQKSSDRRIVIEENLHNIIKGNSEKPKAKILIGEILNAFP